jgi:thymidylate synthase (FAD)
MRLIKPSFEIIEQKPGVEGVYKQIELAGRTCYKSLDKITEDSAKGFVDRMIKSGHGAMLEHGTIYLTMQYGGPSRKESDAIEKYTKNKYSKYNQDIDSKYYITTNLRVLVENNWLDDLQYLYEPTEFHKKRITVRFVTDQGILREFTRHRTASFAVESTRYCNYSKDKFNNELTFIQPCWLDDMRLKLCGPYHTVIRDRSPESIFIANLNNAEKDYLDLINLGWKPQQARNVLPLATKCEMIMTAFVDDWWGGYLVFDKSTGLLDQIIHGMFWKELDNIDREKYRIVEKGFFPLRCSSAAHPQAQELAIPLREEFLKRGYIK